MRAYRYKKHDILPTGDGFYVPGLSDMEEPVSQRYACALIDGEKPKIREKGTGTVKVTSVGNSLGFACTALLKEIGAKRGDLVEIQIKKLRDCNEK